MNVDTPCPGRSGGSASQGKETAVQWLRKLDPRCVLDVGAGQGVWAQIVKQALPSCRMIAVEVFYPTVVEFELQRKYHHVIVADVRWLDWAKVVNDFSVDMVIFGDVLEHMSLVEAKRLVDEVRWRRIPLLVSLPVVIWEQGEIDGNPYEKHIYHWSDERFRRAFSPSRGMVDGPMGVYLIEPPLAAHGY